MRIPILSILLIVISLGSAQAQMPTSGLVAWYPFTGNADDSTGNGNNGTVNGAALTADRFGRANSAYSFNGNSITGTTFTYPIADMGRTISLWFTAKFYPGPTQSYALAGYGSISQSCGSVYGTILWKQPSPSTKQIGTWQGCNGVSPDVLVPWNYTLNTWNHLVVTYDTGFQRIYLNDTLIDTATIGTINTQNDRFAFGHSLIGDNNHFGNLDDIAVYNRALSRCEVHKLFDTTLSFTQQPQSLTALPGTDTIFTTHSPVSGGQIQWQVNTGSGFTNLTNTAPYSGVTSDTLHITTITEAMNNYQYRAVLSYPGLPCTENSGSALLTVIPSAVGTIKRPDLSIYPNPFSSDITIKWTGPALHEGSIRLTDIAGRAIWQSTSPIINGAFTIPATTIAPGYYTINLYDSNTLLLSEKLVKQ